MYVGAEDALRGQYPRNINITVATYDQAGLESGICEDLTGQAEDAAKALGQKPENVIELTRRQRSQDRSTRGRSAFPRQHWSSIR